MKKEKQKIDFVIIWVDGSDEEWQKEKNKYNPNKNEDNRNIRYRDWDNLQYWFRGVEKYAPWVNKIHFVTCGHLPKWLNTEHPKLNIVKHSDFIPEEYLPTFSSHPIELNLHRIEGLEEKFVYFNDDMFIVNNVKETDFFKNELPCDMAVFNPIVAEDETFISILTNNNILINRHFKQKEILKKNFNKYINIKYGINNIRTLLCLPWKRIIGFHEAHHANAFLKNTFEEVWKEEYKILDETSKHKFRSAQDVNQYIFKQWQFCKGNFVPVKNIRKAIRVFDNIDYACDMIKKQKYKLLCLNDSDKSNNFDFAKAEIIKSFERIFPNKSKFEL